MHEQALVGAEEKAFIEKRTEHRGTNLRLQLKDSLSKRWRQLEVWPVPVRVAHVLEVIIKGRHH